MQKATLLECFQQSKDFNDDGDDNGGWGMMVVNSAELDHIVVLCLEQYTFFVHVLPRLCITHSHGASVINMR
jgi:hypothetical protein